MLWGEGKSRLIMHFTFCHPTQGTHHLRRDLTFTKGPMISHGIHDFPWHPSFAIGRLKGKTKPRFQPNLGEKSFFLLRAHSRRMAEARVRVSTQLFFVGPGRELKYGLRLLLPLTIIAQSPAISLTFAEIADLLRFHRALPRPHGLLRERSTPTRTTSIRYVRGIPFNLTERHFNGTLLRQISRQDSSVKMTFRCIEVYARASRDA